jgi:ATP-dependent Lon protease
LIPEKNVKDLQEIPDNVKNQLEIVPVRWIDRVLEVALQDMPQALSDEEAARLTAESIASSKSSGESSAGNVIKH